MSELVWLTAGVGVERGELEQEIPKLLVWLGIFLRAVYRHDRGWHGWQGGSCREQVGGATFGAVHPRNCPLQHIVFTTQHPTCNNG